MVRACRLAVPGLLVLAGLARAESQTLDLRRIEGDYKVRVHSALSGGERYTADNELRIARHGAGAAFVSVSLNFFNGHECYLSGIAAVQGRSLVYRAPGEPAFDCRLRVNVDRGRITFDDEGFRCQRMTCGARGRYGGPEFPLSARRPLRNAAALRRSEEFTKAVETFEGLPPETPAAGR